MPRQIAVDVENNFSGGLVTQATGLNFPKNACVDADNCIFHELGFVERRPGFDFENNFTTKTVNRTSSAVNTYYWRNATGDGTVDLLVSQIGSKLYFYLPDNSTGFSANALATTVDLTSFMPAGAPSPSLTECQYAAGLGYLFVTHPTLESFYITYNSSIKTVTATQITVKIRDTEGATGDPYTVSERPSSLSTLNPIHYYNTHNQGWYFSTYKVDFGTATGTWPSNADIWWTFTNFDDQFDTTTIPYVINGTSQAPRGHYLLDAFNQDRSTASGVGSLAIVSTGYQRPSCTAFYSGRAWYTGVNYSGFESKVYFSQIIQHKDQIGKCYSKEDPTAEDFDLLEADDGGWLLIPGAGLIYKLVAVDNSLVVFASNGIWQIRGSVGIGFTALDYSVNHVSSVKAVSASSFVDIDGYPAFWTIEGVYVLTPTGNGDTSLQVQSLTDTKIKELYLDIPLSCKRLARGSYDPRSHTIQWIYRDTEPSSVTNTYEFNKVLNFNTLVSAWYPWTLPASSAVKINGIFLSLGFGSNPISNPVVAGGVQVVANSVDVAVISFGSLILNSANKFFVSYADTGTYKFTFADFANTNYLDWVSYDDVGIDAAADFITGYKVPTAGAKGFKNNFIYLFSDLTDILETDFYFQGIWNFSNSGDSGKETNTQRVTHSTGSKFNIVRNRLKVRGTGYAAQFKFTSVPGKPFKIIGWTVSESQRSRD